MARTRMVVMMAALILLATPAAALAQVNPDLIHACCSAPRGGAGGVLREVQPGEACRPGETAVNWPARALVLRDLPPVFAVPSPPPGPTVRIIDTSTTIPNLTAQSELRQTSGSCQAPNFIPVGPQEAIQKLMRIVRTETGTEATQLADVRFVPLIPGKAELL